MENCAGAICIVLEIWHSPFQVELDAHHMYPNAYIHIIINDVSSDLFPPITKITSTHGGNLISHSKNLV